MLFKDVTGQQALKESLIRSVQQDRISHAQLLMGPLGHGGLPLALAYSQYVNCTNRGEQDSCGTCPSCIKAQKLIHPDIHFSFPFPAVEGRKKCVEFITEWRELLLNDPYSSLRDWMIKFEAENKQANITIDECHDIIRRLSMKAFESEYKIMIIWLPEYLGKEGNSLLKILEEPPEDTLFLLVAESSEHILNTILSRTQMVKVPFIELEPLAEVIRAKFDMETDDAFRIAGLSGGDQLIASQLAQHAANENAEVFRQWIELLLGGSQNLQELGAWIDQFAKSGREAQKNFFSYALYLVEEMTRMQVLGRDSQLLSPAELQLAKKLNGIVKDHRQLQEMAEMFDQWHYFIERNASAKILMLNLSIRLGRLFRQKKLILS